MERERYQRLRRLVLEAAEREASERRAFLEAACGDDASLVDEALGLLGAEDVDTRALSPVEAPPAETETGLDVPGGTRWGEYVLEAEVGRGGMGVVYAARGPLGERVALKVFHPHLVTASGMVERFRREAELGRRIDHPNVVRTLDVGEASVHGRALPFLVLEYVEGRTLRALQDDLGALPEALVREIAIQVARGLEAIHAGGVVHRDLKPENVLVTDDRRVRITDLGVAKLQDVTTHLTVEGQFVGSLLYASPEQCEGATVGPASDLYTLGVVLYELATGAHPFEADGPRGILRAHLQQVPDPVQRKSADVSPFLSEVIGTLLAKRPEARFASSRDLCRTLEEGEDGAWWAKRREAAGRAAHPRLPVGRETGVHGRRAQLERLAAVWTDVREGRGRVVFVEGEAGYGKSRLVDAWLQTLGGDEAEVLYASFAPARGRGGLRDAVVRRFGLDDLEARLAPYLADLSDLIGPFAAMVRHESTPDGSAPLSRGSLAAVLGRLLKGLAAERPVVWVVEDLHFADAPARALVLSLARVAADQRALLLVTTRGGHEAKEAALFEGLPHHERIPLGPIGEDAVRALLADALESEALARRLGPTVSARSGGVPLFALQILKDLETRGHIARSSTGDWIEVRRVRDVAAPPALRQAIHDRLQALSRDERAVLDVASLVGTSFDPGLLARVRDTKRIEVLETLGHLERRHGLVRSDAARFRFDHHLIQEVVEAELPPQLRAEYHALLADAIAEREHVVQGDRRGATGELAYRIVRHALDGSDPGRWLPLLGRALEHLQSSLVHEAAIALADRALRLPQLADGPNRVAVLTERARHLDGAGRRNEAEPTLAEAVSIASRVGDTKGELKARVTQAYHWLSLARYDKAAEAAAGVEHLAGRVGDRTAEMDALTVRGQVDWCRGRYEEGRACHERVLQMAREVGDRRFEARALSNASVIDLERGFHEQAIVLMRQALSLLQEPRDLSGRLVVQSNLGNGLYALGRTAEALDAYEATLSLCGQYGFRDGEAVAWVNVGQVRLSLGDLKRARRAYEQCLAICREIEGPRVAAYAENGLAQIAAWEGRTDAARAGFEKALDIRRALGHRPGEANSLLGLGRLAIDCGEEEQARAWLEASRDLAVEIGDVNGRLLATAWLALLPGGDAAAVRAEVEADDARLFLEVKLEVRYVLWRTSRDPADLEAARHLLAVHRARAPADAPTEGTPIHRAIELA